MTLLIENASLIMSVQDNGRFGFMRFGLPESGPMDWRAFNHANRLVDNPPDNACLEIGFTDASLRVEKDALLAVCGAGYQISLKGRKMPMWMSFWAKKGDLLDFEKTPGGNWAYLAASGGICSQVWMGSRSVYAIGGLGRLLQRGDRILIGKSIHRSRWDAGWFIPQENRPAYDIDISAGVVPGPQYEWFTDEAQTAFWQQKFNVTSRSDRMGYRLRGENLTHRTGADLLSQGMVMGEIQVPPDGQPIVMMPDHPTTGGYTSIGTVCRADLSLIAQAQPGISEISFIEINLNDARDKLTKTIEDIDKIEKPQEDVWTQL
ncbi:MAG: biotin-dependent carboxyltransferase family protein [Brevefilum sp.]|nr:biotin-dependent carboxyltransferase family protein [Brevefilum sp.]MDT8381443.1 biotin-dependent carboxyltransferase family protein [Brevefilum sp.]MDW7753691.1 biotin-dependent carboxyltransferase family protein [Brevefilum sp.]